MSDGVRPRGECHPMQLSDSVQNLPRITKPQIAALKKLGIQTLQDLLLYFPSRYLDFSKFTEVKKLVPNEAVTIRGTIKSIESRFSFRGRMSIAEAIVSDQSGSVKIIWFNQGYLAKSLKKGEELFISGTPEYYKSGLQFTNPIYEKASDLPRTAEGKAGFPIHTSRLVPVYRLPAALYPKTFRGFVAKALPLAAELEDILPENILRKEYLPDIATTVRFSHFPESLDQAISAKKRLAFEEIFLSQLLAQKHKMELAKKQSFVVPFDQELVKSFLSTLPFELTNGQKKAAWDILQDMEKTMPMNRLLEADVGSGKTLVALIAALEIVKNGLQVAFLAPTEILARQHYETAKKYLAGQGKICLLTNHYSEIDDEQVAKKKLLALLSEGMPGLYIGTHALIQERVSFEKLALVIIDEQHRFGVEQRSKLINLGKRVPHLLSLTATPIPRTLQLAFYGDLDISQIHTKPANRKPIVTRLVQTQDREQAYEFVRKQIFSGRQAFVITPLIEESETLNVKAAKTEVENLKKIFPEFTVGLMHGKLKGEEKEQVMADFLANKIQILVSTSVVEVGVDVPNASVMVIEGAERFGLAQLHQFRGRVGRAEHQSYCLLFTSLSPSPPSQEGTRGNSADAILERLEAFTKTHDGFELAELDLKQRGFGELYGQQQSGWNFKYFSPVYTSLIEPARRDARELLEQDFGLKKHPRLKEQIAGKVIHFE